MKKSVLFCGMMLFITLFSCSKYDDTALKTDVKTLETRLQALERRCDEMNTYISSLPMIIDALQKQKTITNVSTSASGYVITFSDNQSITLSNGKDGSTPAISVRQDSDGTWYWSLNGEWLLDAKGNKIRATATDGVTPKMKIENEYWYVSYDNGQTWIKLEKAKGEDGAPGEDGDSFFKSISQDEYFVYIVLADGTKINIPKESKFALSFEKTAFHPSSETMTIPFTVIAAGDDLHVVAFSDDNISASVFLEGNASGHIAVSFSDGNYNGDILVAAKSNGRTVMEILEFEEGVLSTSSNTEYSVGSEGGIINVAISRNMDIKIGSSVSWITVKPQTKAPIQERFLFEVAANESYQNRDGTVTINGAEGLSLTFTIRQAQKDYIQLDKDAVSILDDETVSLGYTTNVSGTVSWTSSNPGVATVDSNGKVTAVSKGETTITVKTADGKCTDDCKVTVKRFVDGIRVSCTGGSFRISNTLILYGSTLNWAVNNTTGHTVTVDNVYLVDGENGNKTGTLNLNKDLASGSSVSWGISVPLAGIHYPVTAVFSISYNGKTYSASGRYTYTNPIIF